METTGKSGERKKIKKMYGMCIILWDGAIIGVYTKEKIINTYPPLFIQAHRNNAVGLDFSL